MFNFQLTEDVNVEVTVAKRNVNNDRIFRIVDDAVMQMIYNDLSGWMFDTSDLLSSLGVTAEITESILELELEDEESISNVAVMCDRRNNDSHTVKRGEIHMSVRYQQRNCLNGTRLDYTLTRTR